MLDEDLKQVLAELAEANRQTALCFQEQAEGGQHVDRRLDELARQIGGLGNKFGTFTEGLVWSSLQRILRGRLGLHTRIIIPTRRRHRHPPAHRDRVAATPFPKPSWRRHGPQERSMRWARAWWITPEAPYSG